MPKNFLSSLSLVSFVVMLCSCSSQKTVITDYVHDTLIISSVQHDSIYKEVARYDTLILTQKVEVETVIRQDSAGKELSRETNRNTTSDTYRSCSVTDKDYQAMVEQDSIASSKNSDKHVEKTVEPIKHSWLDELWQKVKMCAWIVCGAIIGYIIGRFWSQIRQALRL